MFLNDLDLIAVRILDEEKTRKPGSIVLEIHELARGETGLLKPGMFGIDIVHDEGGMAVAVAKLVSLLTILVDGQFQFESVFGIG